jgi:hypothetical protein
MWTIRIDSRIKKHEHEQQQEDMEIHTYFDQRAGNKEREKEEKRRRGEEEKGRREKDREKSYNNVGISSKRYKKCTPSELRIDTAGAEYS